LASATVKVKSAIAGAVHDLGPVKFHCTLGDARVGNGGAMAMRSYMAGMTVRAGAFRDGVSDQYGLDTTYPLSKRIFLYAATGYTKNGNDVRLNSAKTGQPRQYQVPVLSRLKATRAGRLISKKARRSKPF